MINKLKETLLNFCKTEGVHPWKMKKEFLQLALSMYDSELEAGFGEYKPEDPRHKAFSEFHYKIAQEIIDFINETPGLKEMISNRRKVIEDFLEKEMGHKFSPDLRVYYSMDCLDASLESGEWVPYSDSCLRLEIGGVNVIDNM